MRLVYKIFFISIVLLFTGHYDVTAQCSGGTSLATIMPCAGNNNTYSPVSSGNYVEMYVVSGLEYTITSNYNELTVRDSSDATVIDYSGTGSKTVTFTATYDGYVRVYNCHFNIFIFWPVSVNATFTYSVSGGSNDIDVQSYASNVWNEYYYQRLDNVNAAPSDANAYSRFIGYNSSTQSETFDDNFGSDDDNSCLATIYSQGQSLITLRRRYFAVKYKMNSTKPEGAYIATIGGDDGIRLKVDGTLYFNKWVQQSYTTYTKELFPLNGNSNLEFDYYESDGGNRASFQSFSRVANTVTSAQTICQGANFTQLNGNNTKADAPISNDSRFTITYQWQQSSDSISFSDISGATSQNYTPTLTTPGTYYIRRTSIVSRTNDGMSSATSVNDHSNVLKLIIRASPTVTITGTDTVCKNAPTPSITFTNSLSLPITVTYNINGGTNQTISVPASSTNSVSVSTSTPGTYTYNLVSAQYQSAPNCPNTISGSAKVTVKPLPDGALADAVICEGEQAQMTFTASEGDSPFSLIINGHTYTNINSGTPFNLVPNPNNTTEYDLTLITDANSCSNP